MRERQVTAVTHHEQSFDELVGETERVLAMVASLLGESTVSPARTARIDAEVLRETLSSAELALTAWSRCHTTDAERVAIALNELRRMQLATHYLELRRRHESVHALHDALRRLRTASTVHELASQVPHEAAKMGFDRTLFSWLDNRRWVPAAFHTSNGPEEARAVMEAGSPYHPIGDLLEGEMVRERRPMIVRNALDHPRVHPRIQSVMHSHAYVAAPVLAPAGVVAFISADQNTETGTVDDFDRDLVAMFGEGVGLALERVSMIEEMDQIRSRLGQQADSLRNLMADFDGSNVSAGAPSPPGRGRPTALLHDLTRREEDVLRLVATGLSNAEIADRLYIAVGTAKTHVKNVLHKLGAENRAQAVAIYHSQTMR